MADAAKKIERAELRVLKSDGNDDPNTAVPVQFNPETLKVSYSNQIKTDGSQEGTSSTLYVGRGTTKLSVQLWFDVTVPLAGRFAGATDVRQLTTEVTRFMMPVCANPGAKDEKCVPPGVRFLWGTFQFDGIMESLEESLEFFSAEGRPLRASVSIGLSQQKIDFNVRKPGEGQQPGAGGAPGGAPPGTSPLAEAPADSSLQKLAAGMGKADKWQRIARNNGIENPRRLTPGQLIDMSAPGLKR
jgi:hypothetical protein